MNRFLGKTFTLFLLGAVAFRFAPAQPVVAYDIKARLDPASKTVAGEERLVWFNASSSAVTTVPFHLYLNAFRNNRSTFMKESGRAGEGRQAEDWGHCRVKGIRLESGEDLLPSMRFLQPDDGNPDDRTVMEVALPKPVEPGGSAVFLITFESKLPRVVARSGWHRNFFMVAQWFPKVGVLLDGGWNCHQYHARSEFFADFGSYRVEITTPSDFVVGATGRRIDRRENKDGSVTVVHEQDRIHDFAWAACPDFLEYRKRFRLEEPRVETDMIFLIHKDHQKLMPRHLKALTHALEFYSRSFGPYPYPTITLVDPAPGAQAAGGMEYPTLFTTMSLAWLPSWIRLPEMVTIHEFGHNYWYGMIGSNEFEEAWLDEGINTYSEIKALAAYPGGGDLISLCGLDISDLEQHQLSVFLSGKFDPVVRNSWEFVSGGSYSLNVYAKAGLALLMLERMLGPDVMDRIMKAFFGRWRFGHPTTTDFVAAAEEESGRDLGWFFDQFFYSPDALDYAVGSLSSEPVPDFAGIDDEGEIAGASPASRTTKPDVYRNEAVIVRLGEHVFPQEIEAVFEGGRTILERWDGRERWKRFVWTSPDRVRSVRLDPRGVMVLDANTANNSRTRERDERLPRKIGLRLMGALQRIWALMAF
ncbi:MAG: M1 family metallopeptidase [Candidatus Aminicenantes bacterium]|nr:M1 family metallopeptidase [Candidatus Aminicenantes bacterium]